MRSFSDNSSLSEAISLARKREAVGENLVRLLCYLCVSCQLVVVCDGVVLTDSSADLCEHPSSRLWQQVRVAAACQG